MQLSLSADQEMLRATTAKYLDDQVPPSVLRRLRDDPTGFDRDYWTGGAALGWASLLVPEERGGGTISGNALADLTLIAHEFGAHAAPGPLVPTNIVAATLGRSGSHDATLEALMTGRELVAWCLAEPAPHDGLRDVALDARVERGEVVLNGTKRPVESADVADHLLVTGRTDGGLTQVLVPVATPGVSMRTLVSVDLNRRFSAVTFDDVRVPDTALVGEPGAADHVVEQQLAWATVVTNAESVGAMQVAFDMTLEWAFDRYSFGRPLASYQEIKHRFADMKMWLETSQALSDAAADAVDDGSPEAAELVSAAKAYIGEYGTELAQDCVQLHGGIGLTFEHDLHLFLRRVSLNCALYGTPTQHRLQLASILRSREVSA